MRKRVINHVADTIFWYILYFLPVLAYLMFVISAPFRSIFNEEIFAPNIEYREQWYAKMDTSIKIASELPMEDNPYYNAVFILELSYDYTVDGVSTTYNIPVMVDTRIEKTALNVPDNTAVLSIDYDFTKMINSLTSPFIFKVPFQNFYSSGPIFLRGYNPRTNSLTTCFRFFSIPLADISYYSESVPVEVSGGMTYDFKDFVNQMGFEFATDNIIVNSLSDIFGTGGIMPMFDNDTPFIIFAWFIGVYLLHLLVDFLLFIPRIAHKWMKDCTGGD